MEQNKSEDYIKGFVDALEFVVKSFRNIQFNSPQTKHSESEEASGSTPHRTLNKEDNHNDTIKHKEFIDKDYGN